MSRPVALAAAAVPPLLLAGLGYSHPTVLTMESAEWWRDLHIIGLIAFPLLALGPWVVVRGHSRAAEIAVLVLGLVFAAFYTALDVLAGIGGGHTTMALGPGPWVGTLFQIADQLVIPGVYAYLASALLAGAVVIAVSRGAARIAAVVGTLIVVGGAYSFITSHIYWPVGVLTMLALAVGWTILAAVVPQPVSPAPLRRRQPAPTSAR